MSSNVYTPEVVRKLGDLHDACRKIEVGYSLTYEEAANTWYTSIHSAARSENFTSKSLGTLEFVLDLAIEWVENLTAPKG